MTYYDKVYAELWKKLGELGVTKVTKYNAKTVCELGFQYRPGMSFEILAEMLNISQSTLKNWGGQEFEQKKVSNSFRK